MSSTKPSRRLPTAILSLLPERVLRAMTLELVEKRTAKTAEEAMSSALVALGEAAARHKREASDESLAALHAADVAYTLAGDVALAALLEQDEAELLLGKKAA